MFFHKNKNFISKRLVFRGPDQKDSPEWAEAATILERAGTPEEIQQGVNIAVRKVETRSDVNEDLTPQVSLERFTPSPAVQQQLQVRQEEFEDKPIFEWKKDAEGLGTLGHFELQSKLGKGAFGEVFKARDRNAERDVAIKVIRPNPGAKGLEKALSMMEKEAENMAIFRHANVTPIHSMGVAKNPNGSIEAIFFIMPYSEKGSLKGQIADISRQTEEEKLNFTEKKLLGIAEGLAAIHEAKLIHRDLKPDNVLISDAGYYQITDLDLLRQ